MNTYRIHGDNIVECERIVNLIKSEIKPVTCTYSLSSPSTITVDLEFFYLKKNYTWHLELLPGFNKSGRKRWPSNIFDSLQKNGSFLEETPDVILTKIDENTETILCAIEFCSALQAGNQAWQRSGRAFSTGRAFCPYLYIVDFVKYELNPVTRTRKTLRFPNPAVPYSYINFSNNIGNFVAQIYIRSEDFDIASDPDLSGFNENNFGETELCRYIVRTMCGMDTSGEEKIISEKNLNIVLFLAGTLKSKHSNFTPEQWLRLSSYDQNIIDYSLEHTTFPFRKKIAAKSSHGHVSDFLKYIAEISIGLTSSDLPAGIIPGNKRRALAKKMNTLYPEYDQNILDKIASSSSPLIICIVKGFKPGGDDNRPDRGVLPLTTMLSGTQVETLTYIYGPIIERNYTKLMNDPAKLASSNGFWKAFLSLSDFVALDSPILKSGTLTEARTLLDTSPLKKKYTGQISHSSLSAPLFPGKVQEFHEDDVDTGIHYVFAHLMGTVCFEGLCNPPGGDWSGISILNDHFVEKRWLSLPRVSRDILGKRPDHVYEIFHVWDIKEPVLLIIESKEFSSSLENQVGIELKNYLHYLMNFAPNVERILTAPDPVWQRAKADNKTDITSFKLISAAAYLKEKAQCDDEVYEKTGCDMLFIMEPQSPGWKIRISTQTVDACLLKNYIRHTVYEFSDIIIE